MSDAKQNDSPPLTKEEIADIREFYAHPEDHKVTTAKEFIRELHEDVQTD